MYIKLSKLLSKIESAFQWRFGRFIFRMNGLSFGKNLIINGYVYVKNGLNTVGKIGDNCTFKSGKGLNPLSRNIKSQICIENNASLIVGNNCGFSSVCLWAHKSIQIGNFVNVGADTIILDSDAHSLSFIDRRNIEIDLNNKINKSIIIEDDVLIGTRCIILKGVRIGARSIIGSGSVVVNDIPENSIAAGNPARVIKKIKK